VDSLNTTILYHNKKLHLDNSTLLNSTQLYPIPVSQANPANLEINSPMHVQNCNNLCAQKYLLYPPYLMKKKMEII